MTALTAPSRPAPSDTSRHAGWFLSRNATRLPGPSPSAARPPATRRIRSSHCAQVHRTSPYVSASASGCSAAQCATTSVMNSTPGGATTDMTYSYGPARRLHQPAVHPATLTGRPANGNHVPGRRWLASGIADATRRGRRTEAVRGRLGKVGRGVKGRWLGQLNPVSPLPLGQVEGRVGEPFEPFQRAAVMRKAADTDRGRDGHLGAWQGDLGDRRADALGDLGRRGHFGVREEDRELLTAIAPGKVLDAQHAPQHRADIGEDLVPHGMTPLVVNLL